jgi:hypothetical protein
MTLYSVNVSLLKVKSKPSDDVSKSVSLKRGMVVKRIGPPVTYKQDQWVHIETVNKPIVNGYVQAKYMVKIS